METITDWLYHHKTLLIILIIIGLGSIGSVFALNYEGDIEETEVLSDAKTEEIEDKNIENNNSIEEIPKEETTLWSVDIKGQIKSPGVYQIKEGTRIYEIIELAGGLLNTATTENINLSKKASDEMVIYIFSKEEYQKKTSCPINNESDIEISEEISKKESIVESNKNQEKKKDEKISINKATKEELMNLEGIGESKAENIIKYRTEHQGFKGLEELKEISGIGESIYEKIKSRITL